MKKQERPPGSEAKDTQLPGNQAKETHPAGNQARDIQPPIWVDLMVLLVKIAFISIFLILLFTFMFGIHQAPDNTMKPAVKEGDLVIYYRLQKDYVKNDLITVEYNGYIEVRRVVAVAGDTVDINENGLMINGYHQVEEDIYTNTLPYKEGITFPVTVPENSVFVLADDRNSPEDSRIYGPVQLNATHGRVITTIRRRSF